MRRIYSVSIGWFRAILALQVTLGGVLLGLMALRWPLVGGVVLAVGVSVVMWAAIYRIVTRGHQPLPTPARDAAATVDGMPVKNVEVMP